MGEMGGWSLLFRLLFSDDARILPCRMACRVESAQYILLLEWRLAKVDQDEQLSVSVFILQVETKNRSVTNSLFFFSKKTSPDLRQVEAALRKSSHQFLVAGVVLQLQALRHDKFGHRYVTGNSMYNGFQHVYQMLPFLNCS